MLLELRATVPTMPSDMSFRVAPALVSAVLCLAVHAQSTPPTQPAEAVPAASVPATAQTPQAITAGTSERQMPEDTAEQLAARLQGKTLYLRGSYSEDTLHFDATGKLDGTSPRTSHTLSLIEITHARLEKHRLELEGVRYGLHFLGALSSGDSSTSTDKVRLTAKKRSVKITIEREPVVVPKPPKHSKGDKKRGNNPPASPAPAAGAEEVTRSAVQRDHPGVPIATSRAQAEDALSQAVDRIFASSVDERMVASLPDFWQPYYRATASGSRGTDAAVLKPSQVEKKPRLLTAVAPPSNEYAEKNGVVGMAMYHVVIGEDGKPEQIAVGRPIGMGLDENAIASIRKAVFEPGMKDGKPVPVAVDLVVQFRIWSGRTGSAAATAAKPDAPPTNASALPGPYSAGQP